MPNELSPRLRKVLLSLKGGTIAVSGGVDSMTLSSFANLVLGPKGVRMVHAVSPAVPAAATIRVHEFAAREGWQLTEVDAGEFDDPGYRANPVDRCFYCKSNLYRTLHRLADGVIMSGTNCDDLNDYRPGLKAAAKNSVRHPYVEVGMVKADIRGLARKLGLETLAELPASPCLSSRIETGIRVEPELLSMIDEVETWIQATLRPRVVRCRIRDKGVIIEIDSETLNNLTTAKRQDIIGSVRAQIPQMMQLNISFSIYRRGSAFIGSNLTPAV